jgi:signal transduction histidine kinase
MMLPKQKLFTSNILICMAIALFMFFLVQTPLLYGTLYFLLKVLVSIHFALMDNKASFTPTTVSLAMDLSVVLACAYFWTYLKTPANRIVASLSLGLVLIPVALYLFARLGVLSISLFIVLGVTFGMALDAAQEYFSNRLRRKIVEEKNDAEFNILRHLNHNVKPNILMAKSPITAVASFLESRDMLDETLSKRLDGSDETVREALDHALISLEHINDILESTRKLVTHEIRREEFQEVDIRELFEREIIPLFASKMPISVESDNSIKIRLHRQSFIEAILNLIRNAEVHGYQGDCSNASLLFRITDRRKRIVIDYINNGRPFPANLNAKDFLAFGRKSGDSPGEGLGGAWIGKVLAAHNGSFEIIRDEHPLHFRIMLPKGGI